MICFQPKSQKFLLFKYAISPISNIAIIAACGSLDRDLVVKSWPLKKKKQKDFNCVSVVKSRLCVRVALTILAPSPPPPSLVGEVSFLGLIMEGWDTTTKSTLTQIPLLSVKAGPRDGGAWTQRLKEEYKSLIAYTSMNKANDNDWFRISASNPEGTRWTGKCWYVHNLLKYEFDLQFDIPVTYPATAPELELPQLDGKTQKVYF